MPSPKSQISLEFLFAIGVVLFIFIFILIFTIQKKAEVSFATNYLEAKTDCIKLSNLINSVYVNQDSNVTFKLKNNATISPGLIEVNKDSQITAFCTFSVSVSNGSHNNFQVRLGNVTLRNSNNSVIVTNV